MNHVAIFSFDASGNRVFIADARRTPLKPSYIFSLMVRWDMTKVFGVSPEMYAVLSQTPRGLKADFWNPDSTRERVCGNALRCLPFIARHIESREQGGNKLIIDTRLATVEAYITGDERGAAVFPSKAILVGRRTNGDFMVDPGTPHRVRFVSDIRARCISKLGLTWSQCSRPVNATFVRILPPILEVRTFERGVGETMSCGTGALSAFVAYNCLYTHQPNTGPVTVRFDSGEELTVSADEKEAVLILEGGCDLRAVRMFKQTAEGKWELLDGV